MSTQTAPSMFDRIFDRFQLSMGSLTTGASSHPPPPPLPPSNNKTSKTSSSSVTADELVALGVELSLRLLVAVSSSYLLLWLTKRFFANNMPSDGSGDVPSNAMIYKRLHHILSKRQSATTHTTTNDKSRVVVPVLSSYERQMAEEIIDPDDIESSFADIGGLDDTKREIYELAILPLVQPHLFSSTSKLVQPCKGILLYGKPGTGKTMLAKSLAKEAQAIFLPLQLSKILNKWVGESNKLIAASFSLAHKLQPAVIFIDELDTFLMANNSETKYLDSIKAEFLTLWDGIATTGDSRVMVLGATNKPQAIDPAILRRMPRAFLVPLPDQAGRLAILELLFADEHVDESLLEFLPHVAQVTEGYSGSDLKEVCKAAAMVSIQERTSAFAKERVMGLGGEGFRIRGNDDERLRPINREDLLLALEKVGHTGAAANAYGNKAREESQADKTNELNGLAALLRSLSGLSVNVNRRSSDDIPIL
jgi:SpoVK/Ycf46/Vps4 family AAA+-type ATPase